LAALVEATGDDRVPGAAPERVAHARRTVDEVLVLVVLLRQLREARACRRAGRLPHRSGNEREHFGGRGGVEALPAALVRRGGNHRGAPRGPVVWRKG